MKKKICTKLNRANESLKQKQTATCLIAILLTIALQLACTGSSETAGNAKSSSFAQWVDKYQTIAGTKDDNSFISFAEQSFVRRADDEVQKIDTHLTSYSERRKIAVLQLHNQYKIKFTNDSVIFDRDGILLISKTAASALGEANLVELAILILSDKLMSGKQPEILDAKEFGVLLKNIAAQLAVCNTNFNDIDILSKYYHSKLLPMLVKDDLKRKAESKLCMDEYKMRDLEKKMFEISSTGKILVARGIVIAGLSDSTYEVTCNGRRAILRTVKTEFSSKGFFTLPVTYVGVQDVKTVDGFNQEWDVYKEVVIEDAERHQTLKDEVSLLRERVIETKKNMPSSPELSRSAIASGIMKFLHAREIGREPFGNSVKPGQILDISRYFMTDNK